MVSALKRLKASRIWLIHNKPFFGYVAMYLNFVETDKIETCAVDKDGNFYYNPKFIDELNKDEVRGVTLHELLHIILDHLNRIKHRDMKIWNVATDSVINYKIKKEGLSLPKCGIIPEPSGLLEMFGKKYNMKNKSSEKFYNEIYDDMKNQMNNSNCSGNGDDSDNGVPKGFDSHIYKGQSKSNDKNKGKDNQKQLNKKMTSRDWQKIMAKAKSMAQKSQSKTGSGEYDRFIDDIMQPKISWQTKIRQLVKDYIPFDYTFQRPSRKSYYIDAYLPSTEKEKVEVVINIDSSGSMGKKELTRAISEVIGIRNSYQNLKLIILYSDTKVYEPVELENPTPEQIVEHRPKGGGGTDHRPVFEYLSENYPNARLVVCFTDGMTTFPKEKPNINIIWCLVGGWKVNKDDIPYGEIVDIDE